MNYTKPSRNDGCWDIEQECYDEDAPDYGPVEIFKQRRADGPGKGTRRPICTIENDDMDGPKSECGGNIALIVAAPLMYESLKRALEALRFCAEREKARNNGGLSGELIDHMNDCARTLKNIEWTYKQLMSGEHVA